MHKSKYNQRSFHSQELACLDVLPVEGAVSRILQDEVALALIKI